LLLLSHHKPRLPRDKALLADTEPNSPAVKGLSREERNAAVKDLCVHCKAYVSVTAAEGTQGRVLSSRDLRLKESSEKAIQALLAQLGWRRQCATWSSEWWAVEEAWTAPWLPALGESSLWHRTRMERRLFNDHIAVPDRSLFS
jgi:hypothetical protein